jgi:hypothetical protein
MKIEITINEKQAKYFEIDGEYWAYGESGWYNGLDDELHLMHHAGGTKFIFITIDTEGTVSKEQFNFEKECWE